jgi:hypothetical protein
MGTIRFFRIMMVELYGYLARSVASSKTGPPLELKTDVVGRPVGETFSRLVAEMELAEEQYISLPTNVVMQVSLGRGVEINQQVVTGSELEGPDSWFWSTVFAKRPKKLARRPRAKPKALLPAGTYQS